MATHPVEPLLRTKLFIPQIRHETVRRPRLISRLNSGLRCALTLVSAPAGFGKTTALVEWASQLPMPVAWLSLDEGDNDLARFFALLCSALQTVLPRAGEAALVALRSPRPTPVDSVLTALINEIAAGADEFALVVDDYHLITAQPVHDVMSFLIDHMPAPMHLVVATRMDPGLPLARLRGGMQLVELRAADLRFSSGEAAAFLNQVMGLGLSDADVAALEARTEGWIVGLQLAALSMRGRSNMAGLIAAFTGSHRYILDYLTEEVLRRQPKAVRTFLLRTSVLDRLCGPLCDALMAEGGRASDDSQSSQAMLEYLERNNLFIVPLDDQRCWYRYHQLFADLLRSQWSRSRAEEALELHRRASLWYERSGLVPEAVRHALDAGDWQRVTDLVERHGWQLLDHANVLTLLGWLAALPEELVCARPSLCIYHAWILLLTGHLDAVEPRLAEASRTLSSLPAPTDESRDMLGQIAAIRAYAASYEGDAARATACAREALGWLPEDDLCMRGAIAYALGSASLLAGDVPGACEALAEASRVGQATGCTMMAVGAASDLGEQQVVLGRLREAGETYQTALNLATGQDGKLLPHAARACLGLSDLHYEWNDLESAMRLAEEAIELGKHWGNLDSLARMPLALARARQAKGDVDGAWQALQEADLFARQHNLDLWAASRIEACRARLWLAPVGGDLAAAARWAEERAGALRSGAELSYVREREHLSLARVLIAQGRHGDALQLLGALCAPARADGRVGRVIEVLVLEAVARRGRGEHQLAVATLEQALALAEPEGYLRTFLDEGAPVQALLSALTGERRPARLAYARALLAAFRIDQDGRPQPARAAGAGPASSLRSTPPHGSSQWVEPLSDRELEVLRCVADGLSNAETAQRLVIAVSTVKRHINHIFAKLGVTTRTQALARARERGLLES